MKMDGGAISQEMASGFSLFSRFLIGMNLKTFYFILGIIIVLLILFKIL
jgi:F0F1-type ATP synthase membrane subunit c/vacuolar-type H+-ATPase subunit K